MTQKPSHLAWRHFEGLHIPGPTIFPANSECSKWNLERCRPVQRTAATPRSKNLKQHVWTGKKETSTETIQNRLLELMLTKMCAQPADSACTSTQHWHQHWRTDRAHSCRSLVRTLDSRLQARNPRPPGIHLPKNKKPVHWSSSSPTASTGSQEPRWSWRTRSRARTHRARSRCSGRGLGAVSDRWVHTGGKSVPPATRWTLRLDGGGTRVWLEKQHPKG